MLNNDKKWWKVRNSEAEVRQDGWKLSMNTATQVGFVPYTILKNLVYKDAPTYWEVGAIK